MSDKPSLGTEEIHLLEAVYDSVVPFLGAAETQVVLDSLRSKISEGIHTSSLKEIHSKTLNCRRCPAAQSKPHLPEWNITNPDLLVVVPEPITKDSTGAILAGNLKHAGFKSAHVGLTYLRRCSFYGKATTDDTDRCFGYLSDEIRLINPKLILLCGSDAHSAFFPSAKIKLSDIMGEIHWLGYFPTLTTWSINYVESSGDSVSESFSSHLQTAYRFCYGDV